MTVFLIYQHKYRDPGTSICLNCPVPEKYLSGNGRLYDTCTQSDWYAKRVAEPQCLIAQAKFYKVSLEEAERIAEMVNLDHRKKITAWRYTEELKEIRNDNG